MKPIFGRTAATTTLVIITAAPLAAQRATEATDAQLRAHCRQAAHALEIGQPAPHLAWAVDQMTACDESAGPALANHWLALREADRDALGQLTFSSRSVRDQRIFDAVLAVAGAADRAPLIRLSALQVLVSYTDPILSVSLEDLERPKDNESLGHILDFAPTDGAVPLAAGDPAAVMDLLRRLVQQEPNPEVKAAARYLLRGLEAHGVS
jgi:hypothetical protein